MATSWERWVRGTSLVSSGFLLACGQLIGIEDLHYSGGTAGQGGDAAGGVGGTSVSRGGQGGSPSSGGTPSSGGRSGNNGAGQTSRGGAPQGGFEPSAGNAHTGGTSEREEGGAAGEPNVSGSPSGGGGTNSTGGVGGVGGDGGEAGGVNSDPTVRGRIIDMFGQPVASATVEIGQAMVQSDADGRFTIPDVPSEYDVHFVVRPIIDNISYAYTWIYQGLTRRDPTLQVYVGRDRQVSRSTKFETKNLITGDDIRTEMAFGSPHGTLNTEVDTAIFSPAARWNGPRRADGYAHFLTWSSQGLPSLPVAYLGYTVVPGTLLDSGSTISAELSTTSLMTSNVQGSVTSASLSGRMNQVYVQFADNAKIQVVNDGAAPDSFSYLVPHIVDSFITVSASHGEPKLGAFAIAHRRVTAGQTGISLSVPAAPIAMTPGNFQTGVNAESEFAWTGPESVYCLKVWDDFESVYVVTTRKRVKIPRLEDLLNAKFDQYWRVEVHGDHRNVDEASGPHGFQDTFGPSAGAEPRVFRSNESGSYTVSERRAFHIRATTPEPEPEPEPEW